MALVRLEALAPRSYCLGHDDKGRQVWARFTAEDCRMHADKLNRMLHNKAPLPACWEHRDDQSPRALSRDDWRSEQAKGTAGWLERVDLTPENRLFLECEIPDPEDVKRAKANRFCSPQIEPNVVDGLGNEYGTAFVHLALTPKPIRQDQPPIQMLSKDGSPVAAMLGVIRLSVDPLEGKDMADDKKSDEKKDDKPKGGDNTSASPKKKQVIEALASIGIMLGDDTPDDMDGFLDRLLVGLNTHKAVSDPDSVNEPDEAPEEVPPPGNMGAAPIMMSKLQDLEKKDVTQRLRNLLNTNRITPAEHAKKTGEFGTIKLSVDEKTGDVTGHAAIVAWIEARESLPKGTAFPKTAAANNAGKVAMSKAKADDPPGGDQKKDNEAAIEAAKAAAKPLSTNAVAK